MMEAETTKPHLNLMADGSEKHKQAMLSSPLESVAIGGKLLEGWTTPGDGCLHALEAPFRQ
jgi:hypothetical protein